MGKIVEKRKKKKGRPSLLDLQKRSLKEQQEQQQQQEQTQQQQQKQQHKLQNPNPHSSLRRSTRRNPNPTSDDDGTTRQKKLKHVLKLRDEDAEEEKLESEDEGSDSSGSNSNPKKRKIGSIGPGSGLDNHDKGEKHSVATNQTSFQQGSMLDDGPSSPLPDKKLLLFILDRLQKKDTYGVFAEPVDPEELPDYHEVISDPMDFSTVRKKLTSGAYASLEQFEKDVYLICSNAMQYNAPDTVYFRQARAIQELAKKNFENLRQDSDDNETEREREPEAEPKVVRRGRPPTKNLKRPPGRPPLEHAKPQVERANSSPAPATLASAGGNTNQSNNDVRKSPLFLDKYGSPDLFVRSNYGLHFGETYIGWSAEKYGRTDDLTGSASKAIMMKHGKKNIVLDENRRNTYRQSYMSASREEPSVLTTFDGERKHLMPVGLHSEYGYARSLGRFAAKLGPVAWKVASRKIQRCLPTGVKFGPGWVGENEAPAERQVLQQLPSPAAGQSVPSASLPIYGDSSSAPKQGRVESNHSTHKQEEQSSKTNIPSIQPKLDKGSSKVLSPSASDDGTPVSSPVIAGNGGASKLSASEASTSFQPNTTSSMLNRSTGGTMKAGQSSQIHQNANNHPRINGLKGSYGLSFAAQMGKMIGAGRPAISRCETDSLGPPSEDNNGCEGAKMAENSSAAEPGDCLPNPRLPQKASPSAPDLNVGFQSPGSPCSGRADSVQPDLALQL